MDNQYVVFKLFNQHCAISLDMVIEVCNVTTLIKTKAKELNVMVWRNHPIPVIDPTAMMSKLNKEQEITKHTKILVVKLKEESREIAIIVDAVIGIDEIKNSEIEEAYINDARYIVGRASRKTYQLKLIDMKEFLKSNVTDKFPIVYSMRQDELDKGIKIAGSVLAEKEEVLDTVRLKAINWLIKANKRNVEEMFVVDMKKIYDLTLNL